MCRRTDHPLPLSLLYLVWELALIVLGLARRIRLSVAIRQVSGPHRALGRQIFPFHTVSPPEIQDPAPSE
jgi:hypothetical protein